MDNIWQGNQKRAQRTHSVEYGYRPDLWELNKHDLTIKEQMNEGFFGEVYRGVVKGPLKSNTHLNPTLRNASTISVAVKYLKRKLCTASNISFHYRSRHFKTITEPFSLYYSCAFLLICNFIASYPASAQGVDKSDFLNEIDILKKIFEEGSSPYVVTLVGCVTLQEPVCLVTALVAHGNLRDYLNYIRAKVSSSSDIRQTSHSRIVL